MFFHLFSVSVRRIQWMMDGWRDGLLSYLFPFTHPSFTSRAYERTEIARWESVSEWREKRDDSPQISLYLRVTISSSLFPSVAPSRLESLRCRKRTNKVSGKGDRTLTSPFHLSLSHSISPLPSLYPGEGKGERVCHLFLPNHFPSTNSGTWEC